MNELFVVLTPFIVLVAWWTRWQDDAQQRWRSTVTRLGLIASSVNVLVFWTFIAWWKLIADHDPVWINRVIVVQTGLGDWIAAPLTLLALLGGILGKGWTRMWLIASALTGFLMWVPVAFL